MPGGRILFTLVLLWHVVAMVAGAIPSLDDFGTDQTANRPPGTTIRSRLTSLLDQVGEQAIRGHRMVVASLGPVRNASRAYLDLIDQSSKWNMFSRPAAQNEFVRIDYVIRGRDGLSQVESELVYPAAAPGEWRIVRAYFSSFFDKAFANGAEIYLRRAQNAERIGVAPPQAAMADDLRPFLAYYGNRHRRTLPSSSVLERAEYWRGWAPVPRPGMEYAPGVLDSRLGQLKALAKARPLGTSPSPDADITWRQWLSLEFSAQ
jgi:hypothetical protein